MTPETKPYLFLNRLIITSYTGAISYDQVFHKGVNIIRGKNSSGKSTISNFIFFALGGDYNNWNAEELTDGIYYYSFALKSCPIQKGWLQIIR